MTEQMQAFVDDVLNEFGPSLQQEAKDRIMSRNIRVDDALLNSIMVTTATNVLKMMFLDHGRFHDMGARKGFHKGKFAGSDERAEFLRYPKPSKWYSRLAWGATFGRLANTLANAYVEQAPKLLVAEFQKGLAGATKRPG